MAAGQFWQTPTLVSPPEPLPPSKSGATGCLFSGASQAWLLGDNCLRVYRSSRLVALWRPSVGSITHVSELRVSGGRFQLLVSVVVDGSHTVLVVLNPLPTRVVRAISFPHCITFIHPLSPSSFSTPGLFSQSVLSLFSGIAAVGCSSGRLYLVNLCLNVGDFPSSSLTFPAKLHPLQGGAASAEVTRATEEGTHTCWELTANSYHGKKFVYRTGPGSDDSITLPPEAVDVTALHYTHQVCSLFVGFNFGSFQVYSLSRLALVYSSPYNPHLSPVTHFTYQEPENDPRCSVYLWAGRGPLSEQERDCEVSLTLYQLAYDNLVRLPSETVADSPYIYQNFQSCAPRLQHSLTSSPALSNPSRSVGTRLLRCCALNRRHSKTDPDRSQQGGSSDLTLAAFVWSSRVRGEELGREEHFLALFDINQWYHAQMPRSVQWKASGKHTGVLGCSYFATFSLNPALEGAVLLDATVSHVASPSSLPPVPETHLWPTALALDVTAITADSLLHCEFYGVQKTVLHELELSQDLIFSSSQRLFAGCDQADLLYSGWEQAPDHSSVEFQRKALLTVAIDNNLLSVLLAGARQWVRGGCGGDEVVEWVREKVEETIDKNNHLCAPLFSASGSMSALQWAQVGRITSSLWLLSQMLQAMTAPLSLREGEVDSVVQELMGLYYNTVVSIHLLEVIKWCLLNKLLPLVNVSSGEGFCYPFSGLSRMYEHLRNRQCRELAVECLVHQLQDTGAVSEFCYPAPTFDEFLAVFSSLNTLIQHCLMVYFLKDIELLEEEMGQLVVSYCKAFSLPPELTAFAEGLWLLDHHNYQDALHLLISRQTSGVQWFPWQHRLVVESVLQSDQPELLRRHASYFMAHSTSPKDSQLLIGALVSAGCIGDALECVRSFEGVEDLYVEMFSHFLSVCSDNKRLCSIVDVPLHGEEPDLLSRYLEGHSSLAAQELLIALYLKQHRYTEAIFIHEKIKSVAKAHSDARVRERSSFRDTLLAGYSQCVPSAIRKLPTQHTTTRTVVECSLPLSQVLARERRERPLSETDTILTIMDNISSIRSAPLQPLTPYGGQKSSKLAELSHTPFLSTPLSTRKRRERPCVVATPVFQLPPPTPTHENALITEFQTILQNFQERMASHNQSGSGNVLNNSVMHTPLLSKTPLSVSRVSALRSVATPPSILKSRLPLVTSGGVEEEREEVSEENQQTETRSRKIRFFVEGTPISPLSSPIQSTILKSRVSTPYSAPKTSALATPLPSSDDSSLFESPMSSPSQLDTLPSQPHTSPPQPHTSPTQPHTSPTQPHTSPTHLHASPSPLALARQPLNIKLFSQADSPSSETDREQNTAGEATEEEEEEEDSEGVEEEGTVSEMVVEEEGAPPVVEEQPRMKLFIQPLQVTPSNTPGRLTRAAIANPSPLPRSATPTSSLVTHTRSASPFELTRAGKPGLFTPRLTKDIIETNKQKLQSSLEAIRKRDIVQAKTSPLSASSITVVKDQPSATIVKPSPQPASLAREPSAMDVSQFSFSPPAAITPAPPPPSRPPPTTTAGEPFVFSPPLTRSAARRKQQENQSTSGTEKQKTGRSQTQRVQQQEAVSLVTPPSTPIPQAAPKRRPRQPPVVAPGARHSTRLLRSKK